MGRRFYVIKTKMQKFNQINAITKLILNQYLRCTEMWKGQLVVQEALVKPTMQHEQRNCAIQNICKQ